MWKHTNLKKRQVKRRDTKELTLRRVAYSRGLLPHVFFFIIIIHRSKPTRWHKYTNEYLSSVFPTHYESKRVSSIPASSFIHWLHSPVNATRNRSHYCFRPSTIAWPTIHVRSFLGNHVTFMISGSEARSAEVGFVILTTREALKYGLAMCKCGGA